MLHHHQQQHQSSRGAEITSSATSSISTTPNRLAQNQQQQQTPRDTNPSVSIDNRSLYSESLRHQQQAAAAAAVVRHNNANNFNSSSRDSNNNAGQTIAAFTNQKMAIRNSMNQRSLAVNGGGAALSAAANALSPPHGTILFNTLNGGALGSGINSGVMHGATDCFTGPDMVDSTTPPPTAIAMPSASNASSSSSTISTNVGLNRSSNGSHDGVGMEKVKTPNSIRGEQ